MAEWKYMDGARVFNAGKGEWYNQPHDKRWDMGEDVQPLPSPNWHVELEQACAALERPAPLIVVDLTQMSWLVGHDWGFLVRISKSLRSKDTALVVVASERVSKAAEVIQLNKLMKFARSLEEAF
jgi:hypothetical protein